ncbi:MAG: purine-nucleoside phosphorylase [Arenicella sp.]|jgi:purine-nucleoside phosphorylase
MLKKIIETTEFIHNQIGGQPEIGIVLGTGLGGLVAEIDITDELSYEDIPNFPVSTVESHSGKLLFGHLGGKKVLAMQGRFHYYEGYSMQEVTFPIRVMKMLGIQKLFVANAAGGLNPKFNQGDIMMINDHIDLFPDNPLRGANIDQLGERWVDMYQQYNPELMTLAKSIAKDLKIELKEGVYCGVPGPNLETAAEYKYLRTIGGDAVGMSTIPEVIVARHMEIPVFAVSIITDMCTPDTLKAVDIPEIIATAGKAEPQMTSLIKEMIAKS